MKFNQFFQATDQCPHCSSKDAFVVSVVDGKTKKELITISCAGCGLGRVDPLPSERSLEEWYKEKYRQSYKGLEKPKLKYILRAARNARERFSWINENASALKNSLKNSDCKSLDIGASSGEFVFLMKKLGFDAIGIEPHQGYAEYAIKEYDLKILSGAMSEKIRLIEDRSISLVTMFHVLEHLSNPVQSLKEIVRILSPDGYLYIEVPNAMRMTSPQYMFFKAHVLYFTKQTLINLLKKSNLNIVFANDAESGNLRVVARFDEGLVGSFDAGSDHKHDLISAQAKRKWLPYLWRQLIENKLFKKIQKMLEEKNTATRYKNGIELLNDVYKDSKVM